MHCNGDQDILFPLLDKLLIDILNDALSTYGLVILTLLIITMLIAHHINHHWVVCGSCQMWGTIVPFWVSQ